MGPSADCTASVQSGPKIVLSMWDSIFNQLNDCLNGVRLAAVFHGGGEGATILIEGVNCLKQRFVGNLLFLQNHAKALLLKRTGVQDLITSAGGG